MNKTSIAKIERSERIAEALRMRMAGKEAPEIAQRMGVNKTTVYQYIKDGIEATIREPAEAFVALHIMRLEKMFGGVFADAVSGDVKAVAAALKIMEREARLLGLDRAVPTETSGEAVQMLNDFMAALRAPE